MPGLIYSIPGNPTYDFKILAGDNLCTLAGYSLSGTTATTSLRQNITSEVASSLQAANSSAMAFDIGVSIRFVQTKHFFLVLSSDFMYSQAYINTTYNNTGSDEFSWLLGQDHFRVNYNLLSFTAGIGWTSVYKVKRIRELFN